MKTLVISLGGSLIVPEEVDFEFLKNFKLLIEEFIKKDFRFIIITGGGRTARNYMAAANKVSKLHEEDVDWLGIHATRINAHLLRTIFRSHAHKRIITNPCEKISFKEKILIGAGWKPGFSTDMDSVLLAKQFEVKQVINLSNIEYVYDKDPKKFEDAKKIKQISWSAFRKIVGDEWDPGLNAPFDPVASKEAQKDGMTVIITNGKDLKNLKSIFEGKTFKGTIIS